MTRKLNGNWMFFIVDGCDVCRYSIRGSYAGEIDKQAELIANDYGIPKTHVIAEARRYFNGKVMEKMKYDWYKRRFAV